MLTQASRICTEISSLRRSMISERTPAGIASRKIGKVPAAWIIATAAGDAERSVTSQELATSRMKLPVFPRMVAIHRTANVVWRNGAKPLVDVGVFAVTSVMGRPPAHVSFLCLGRRKADDQLVQLEPGES
jgi:hypothetical protein